MEVLSETDYSAEEYNPLIIAEESTNSNSEDSDSHTHTDDNHESHENDQDINLCVKDEPLDLKLNELYNDAISNEAGQTSSFKCNVCSFETDEEKCLIFHKKIHKRRVHKCNSCHYRCGSKFKLQNHQKKEHMALEDLLYYCGDCSYTSLKRVDLIKHRQEHHIIQKKPKPKKSVKDTVKKKVVMLQCPDCLYTTSKTLSLVRHQSTYHQAEVLQCCLCKKLFTDKLEYQNHCLNHETYRKSKFGFFRCRFCSFSSKDEHVILDHKKNSHKESFQCTDCRFSTLVESRFIKHRISEHSAPQFQCKGCRKLFTVESDYEEHMLSHLYVTEQGLSKCLRCDFSSTKKNIVMEHAKKTHKLKSKIRLKQEEVEYLIK